MYLKHLTINGFKSFAKKSELEFSSPITAVVGPNGSGKSNVAESFRFVLGEQSPSKMRGKKGEDLIWGGSDQIARGNRASVSITLDNSQKVFPVDFDEIILERAVHRDGENEYLINGSRVKLRDVQEILAAANIGPSGHHIISQGEADRILSASPRERREMIEDALGLKAFQLKKAEAEKKLEKTRENILKVEGLRREVAPHLRFLEKQVKKLERAALQREELKAAYAEYLKREDIYLTAWSKKLENESGPLRQQLLEAEGALEKARAVLEGKQQDQASDRLVMAERELSRRREERQAHLRQVGALEGQLSFLERQLRAKEESRRRDNLVNIPSSELEKLVIAIEKDAERAASYEDAGLLRRALRDIAGSLRQFLLRATEKGDNSELGEYRAEYARLGEEKREIDRKLQAAEAAEAAAEREYQAIRRAIEADQSESREAEREVFRLVNARRELEAALARLEAERETWQRDQDDFRRELQEAVVLIGRAAGDYLHFAIQENGEAVLNAAIAAEERGKQLGRRRELEKMKIRLEEFGGANEELEKEYQSVKERDDFLSRELFDLSASVGKLEELIAELEGELELRFESGIEKISAEFNRFFVLMFGGGAAELSKIRLEKRRRAAESEEGEESPEEEAAPEKTESGVDIDVKLPNKRVKGLDMLSGGERALTSIALIFAMSQVNPPLFVILDETDAALDEANSRRYGDMIEALSEKSQLILITHNRETMSRAAVLYGVTMGSDGASKLLSVKLSDALAVAK